MRMLMMGVWVMDVLMHKRRVLMKVIVFDATLDRLGMLMLVMLIVDVFMLMTQRLVRVLVNMAFCQMKPNTKCHEQTRNYQREGNRVSQ